MSAASYPVIVASRGSVGLAGAIVATENSGRTLRITENPRLGGTAAWSVGTITSSRVPHQRALKTCAPPDDHYADMALFYGNPLEGRDNVKLRLRYPTYRPLGKFHVPRIIAVNPVRVRLLTHELVAVRSRLNPGCPRFTRGLEPLEGSRKIIGAAIDKASGQHDRIFESVRRPLRHVGRHRVAGIAHERNVSATPGRERIPLKNRPFVNRRTSFKYGAYIGVKIAEGRP